ncbi:hypothetical protein Aperf_G00000035514 [Anoplocephala perfoliata]
MKHTFVSSSSGQQIVTTITENPFQDVSLSKTAEDVNHPHTSRAKQLFNSLRKFTSAGATPTVSPIRASTNGMICRIPRACCRYSSPQKQPDFNNTLQMGLGQNAINVTSISVLENRGSQPVRRRTESDGSSGNITRFILDLRNHSNYDQLSITKTSPSWLDAETFDESTSYI